MHPCWRELPADCVTEIFHWLRSPQNPNREEWADYIALATRTAKWLPRPSSQQLFERMVQQVTRVADSLEDIGTSPSGFVDHTSRELWPREIEKLQTAFESTFPRVRVQYRKYDVNLSRQREERELVTRRPDLLLKEPVPLPWTPKMVLFLWDDDANRAWLTSLGKTSSLYVIYLNTDRADQDSDDAAEMTYNLFG